MGLLPDTQNCGLRMRRECQKRFPVTHVPWCMTWSLTSVFISSWWRGKRSRHSRRMRNLQFYVSGKRPMAGKMHHVFDLQMLSHLMALCAVTKDMHFQLVNSVNKEVSRMPGWPLHYTINFFSIVMTCTVEYFNLFPCTSNMQTMLLQLTNH